MTTTGEDTNTATPTTGVPEHVDPTFAWTLAVSPLIGVALPLAFPAIHATAAFGVAVLLNTVLAIADQTRLSKAGTYINILWALFLIPVYLIVRTVKARSTPAIPVVWFGTFLAALVVANWATITAPAPVAIDSALLEKELTKGIQADYDAKVQVSCPAKIVATIDEPFECEVEASDGLYNAYVNVTDEQGHFTWFLSEW